MLQKNTLTVTQGHGDLRPFAVGKFQRHVGQRLWMLSFEQHTAALAAVALPGLSLMNNINSQLAAAVIDKRSHRCDHQGVILLLGFKPELITEGGGNEEKMHSDASYIKKISRMNIHPAESINAER
nr:hypothetical protein [Kluyvera ascorbata]